MSERTPTKLARPQAADRVFMDYIEAGIAPGLEANCSPVDLPKRLAECYRVEMVLRDGRWEPAIRLNVEAFRELFKGSLHWLAESAA